MNVVNRHGGPLANAAGSVAAVQWAYAQRSRSLADAALAGARRFVEWEHYPHDDCIDAVHGTRFYYHAHPAAERAGGEHGHFHLFVASPAGAKPSFSHLAGLSLDARGLPLRWFTTNRWVTGEHWQPAQRMRGTLRDFELQAHGRLAPIARWLTGMVRLYAGDIGALLRERDERLQAHRREAGLSRAAAFEDRRLHILTQRPVELLQRLAEAQALDPSGDNP